MAEKTTEPPVHITGEQRPHPAVRRLARACIALVRWQRRQIDEAPAPAAASTDVQSDASTNTKPAPSMGGTGAAHD